jgi:lipopolysaccharide export system protein LptA
VPRFSLTALGIAVIFAAVPAPAPAQQSCNQVLRSDFRRVITPAGEEIAYYRNPVRMVCADGMQIEADSAVMNRSANTVELVGHVLYRDGERQLTSEWARYMGGTDELFARGAVVLTDMADASVIRGDEFEYRRETPERPEARMIIWGGRPHAELRRAPDAGGAPGAPVLVRAERLELIGETVFLAQSNVELERDDLRGAADAIRFDQGADRMTLTGNAHVETDAYRLEGDHIDAHMLGDALREVLSNGNARLVGDDLTVGGQHIRIGFVDGEPERVEAWTPPPAASDDAATRAPGARRAVAISRDFRLRADSIDARSVEGRLREVQAVGRAYGEREADTLSVRLPDAIARDWIQGDTIIGYFTDQDPAETEPAVVDAVVVAPGEVAVAGEASPASDLVLERVEVIGGDSDALSLYRTEAPGGGAHPAVNFMRAKRITLFMSDGEVSRVEADGPIEGLYLDPARTGAQPREPAPGRTTAARRR